MSDPDAEHTGSEEPDSPSQVDDKPEEHGAPSPARKRKKKQALTQEQIEALIEATLKNAQKTLQASTYVDFRDGKVVDPEQLVSSDEMKNFINAGKSFIDWEVALWDHKSILQEMITRYAPQFVAEARSFFAREAPSTSTA
jgi:hypothetical protein